jgi:sensor histidine kinase YesM
VSIRTKLLLFIPLLVLLVHSVAFFLFQSGNTVQRSYGFMMDRILLYNQAVQTAEDDLQSLYESLIRPEGSSTAEMEQARSKLLELQGRLSGAAGASLPYPAQTSSFLHMLETLTEQEHAALAAAAANHSSAALKLYEQAEKTTGFIREEGQRLVELELTAYQPIFRELQQENERMNQVGAAIFAMTTLMSIVIAIWISRSITVPVDKLVQRVRAMSEGKLLHPEEADSSPIRSKDELGLLTAAFGDMSTELKERIEKDKEYLEKDRLVKQLELQALQSQMNPHFLFNTLNVLSKLALLEGAERTSDLTVSMSNMLRYNLRKLDQPVTLRDEVAHVQEYFAIQQARFRDRVRFELDIEEAALQVALPPLTLQPLVENAFLHGLEGMERGAILRLDIRQVRDGVRVELSDNGSGMSEAVRQALLRMEAEPERRHSTGLGTRNVFKRLQLYYGRTDLVDIDSEPGQGTRIRMLLPIGKGGEPDHV